MWLMIIVGIVTYHALRQIGFVMAYTQAPIEMDLYMEIPHGIETTKGYTKDCILQLLANIYGQKQVRKSIGFIQSCINECVFYRDDIIFIVYVNSGIFLCISDDQHSHVMKELTHIDLQKEDQGHTAD
ncbi:hypothetical protein ACHAW6_008652 [Cyclotella cf. meneghiniana]